jgi:hypothetical protein
MMCPHCKVERKDCKCCCASECPYLDQEDAPGGPCEGPVEAVDEEYTEDDYWWVHRCEKHAKLYFERGW